jgi:hypothetical protein
MKYEYTGYLSTLLSRPDPSTHDDLPSVMLGPDDLARWSTVDEPAYKEWQHIPVQRTRTERGVALEGRFADVRRMELLDGDDPRYWVALSTLRWDDSRLPIDTSRYPIVEITYRCLTDRALPEIAYFFSGGHHRARLPCSREWCTQVRNVRHNAFPPRLDALIVRLYSATRTTESIEIAAIRFRAPSAAESAAMATSRVWLDALPKPRPYPCLRETVPLGVCMDGATGKRLAHMLGISQREYWDLVMEDLVRHNHNAIAISHIEAFTSQEWRDLLEQAESYHLKFVVMHEFPIEAPAEEQKAMLDTWVTPHVESPTILAWSFFDRRSEGEVEQVMAAKLRLEALVPNHPLALVAREPRAFPYYAPYFAASGMFHHLAHRPWDVGKIVSAHHHLVGGEQFWMVAPAFVHATDSPEWSTSPEMRLMINLAFANGARGWFAFTYHNDPFWVRGHCQRSLTGPFLAFSDLWSEVGERMKFYEILMPLLLAAKPEGALRPWYISNITSVTTTVFPEEIGPVGVFSLRGDDFELFFIINNDPSAMAGFNIQIPADVLDGLDAYDLADYVRTNVWESIERTRHLEMFPGQVRVLFFAESRACEHWRAVLGQRMVEHDRRRLEINLRLARSNHLPVDEIETIVAAAHQNGDAEEAERVHRARNELTNLLYDAPAISASRSKIIEATAALCGCDGTLCRMIGRGKADQAHAYAERVLPLAREITQLRLALRQGKAGELNDEAASVAQRTIKLLAEIRAAT